MKPFRFALAALAFAGAAFSASAQTPPAPSAILDLKRVLLSTGGIGYFEYEAAVEGDAQLPLSVRLDQVDDVLKSIIVFDDRGGVGGIALPGREPLSEAFRDLPFAQADLDSPDGLLNALRGAEVIVGGARQATGRILKAIPETAKLPNDGGEIVRHRVTLMAADGMRQFVLEEAESVKFADPAVQRQVDAALAAIARHRVQDRRTLTIQARGTGKRTVRVGYVVAAPLWKASYRLSAAEGAAKGLLQGWAIVENLSGRDWKGVELTLVSGNPVTFRQQLYSAYFVNRPEVPVEVAGRVLPPADQGSLGTAQMKAAAPEGARRAMAPPSPAPMPAMRDAPYAAAIAAPARPAAQAELAVGETQEAATQVLFTAPQPVSLAAGETLALPIVARDVPVQRVALYQPHVNAANPLAAVEVANDTGAGLPPGALTLYERGKAGSVYVGDARLGAFPAGEKRLLSFAVDLKIAVERETKAREAVAQAKISRGVLTLSYRDEQTTLYRIKAPANEDRVLLIEQPRLADWQLAAPKPADAELTRGHYRIRQALARGGATALEVVVQRPRLNAVQLAGQSRQALLAYARTGGIDPKAAAALERLAALQGEVDRLDRLAKEAEAERDGIAKDQDRLRQNLQSVPAGGDLAKRYLETMKKQEDRIDQLRLAQDDAKAKLKAARDALADAIQKTEI
ncbi:MAG: DUF4139 domain-containing protein [Rhodospirillales bacterium]